MKLAVGRGPTEKDVPHQIASRRGWDLEPAELDLHAPRAQQELRPPNLILSLV